MVARSIVRWPDTSLSQLSTDIADISKETIQLAQDLVDTMNVEFGAGLAAPQIGVHKNIVVLRQGYAGIDLPEDPILKTGVILVNPSVKVLDEEDTFVWSEACLSVPDLTENVKRYKRISLSYTDLSGKNNCVDLHGYPAGVVQHEVDHLDGLLFIDRLSSSKKKNAIVKMRRKMRAAAAARKTKLKRLQRDLAREKAQAEAEADEDTSQKRRTTSSKARKKRPPKTFGKNKRRRK